jgi:hypothetical protein
VRVRDNFLKKPESSVPTLAVSRPFLGLAAFNVSKKTSSFSSSLRAGTTSLARGAYVMSPSGRRTSAQYSGRAAMMAKVACMAGTSAEHGGAPVRLGPSEED